MFRFILAITFVLIAFTGQSQPTPPTTPPPGPGAPVPLSGFEVLIVAGAALGVKKLVAKRKV